MLAGVFILVHAAIPHHHHWDAIFLESDECHHHGEDDDELDEIMVFAYTKQQPFDLNLLISPVFLEPLLIEISAVKWNKLFTVPSIYQESFYHSYITEVQSLRGPPTCYC